MPFATADDGARLYYETTSLVPPWRKTAGVILMHHGVALNGDAWMDWQPALLAEGYRIIRLDMRGFGRSEPTPPGYGWSLANFFTDMEIILAAEHVESFHFVGESIGGLIGLAYAAHRPERLLSGALISTPFDGRRVQVVDRWRATIAAHGMAGWADELMPMRFVEGDVEPSLYRWVRDLQASCSNFGARRQSVRRSLDGGGPPRARCDLGAAMVSWSASFPPNESGARMRGGLCSISQAAHIITGRQRSQAGITAPFRRRHCQTRANIDGSLDQAERSTLRELRETFYADSRC
jgi:pimeloyl-ACP methyl ester carboxylesterase